MRKEMSGMSGRRLLSESPDRDEFVQLSRDLALASNCAAEKTQEKQPQDEKINSREMALALALLCFIGTTFGLVLSTALNMFESPACRDETWSQQDTRITSLVDARTSPCSNMYQHACGEWSPFLHDILQPSRAWSVYDEQLYRRDLQLRRILTQPPDRAPRAFSHAQQLYRQCAEQLFQNEDIGQVLRICEGENWGVHACMECTWCRRLKFFLRCEPRTTSCEAALGA